MVTPEVFEKTVSRIVDLSLLGSQVLPIGLYNWGEPVLNPHLREILIIATRYGIRCNISTNASKLPDIDQSFVAGLNELIFSMPGFSQNSYDRIHGFDFACICKNIKVIVDKVRSLGFVGSIRTHYHVYQFNISEIRACEQFLSQLGVKLVLHYAILNHWDHLWEYVSNNLAYEKLKEVSQDLFMYNLRSLQEDTPESYRCPQYDLLPIDAQGNVTLCCQVPPAEAYFAGNILTDDIEQIQSRREHNDICRKCLRAGMARYLNTSLRVPDIFLKEKESHARFVKRVGRRLLQLIHNHAITRT